MDKQMTILLIDDDIDDTLFFKRVLSDISKSVQFLSAHDGKEALDFLQKKENGKPDLIFLDLNMPRMNGKECLYLIKKDPLLQHIPVIIYTTSSLPRDRDDTIAAGAMCFITKPSSITDLKQILLAVIGNFPDRLEQTLKVLSKGGNHFITC